MLRRDIEREWMKFGQIFDFYSNFWFLLEFLIRFFVFLGQMRSHLCFEKMLVRFRNNIFVNVVCTPDMPKMSLQYPHLVAHGFESKLGSRVSDILRFLFPVPKDDSSRLITFKNSDDYISMRHHTYKLEGETSDRKKKDIVLSEAGPRFELQKNQECIHIKVPKTSKTTQNHTKHTKTD